MDDRLAMGNPSPDIQMKMILVFLTLHLRVRSTNGRFDDLTTLAYPLVSGRWK